MSERVTIITSCNLYQCRYPLIWVCNLAPPAIASLILGFHTNETKLSCSVRHAKVFDFARDVRGPSRVSRKCGMLRSEFASALSREAAIKATAFQRSCPRTPANQASFSRSSNETDLKPVLNFLVRLSCSLRPSQSACAVFLATFIRSSAFGAQSSQT